MDPGKQWPFDQRECEKARNDMRSLPQKALFMSRHPRRQLLASFSGSMTAHYGYDRTAIIFFINTSQLVRAVKDIQSICDPGVFDSRLRNEVDRKIRFMMPTT